MPTDPEPSWPDTNLHGTDLLNGTPGPTVTRTRAGHATNSSSSHSMVIVPPGTPVADQVPGNEDEEDSDQAHHYESDFVAASESAKRHYLAGLLVAQASQLWGQGVVLPWKDDPAYQEAAMAAKDAWAHERCRYDPDLQRRARDASLWQWTVKAGVIERLRGSVRDVPEDRFDTRPYKEPDALLRGQTELPLWMEARIRALCGLPDGTDLSGHWSESHLSGGTPEVPRLEDGAGPDPVAWTAILALALDPTTVLYSPEHNGWSAAENLGQHASLTGDRQ